MDSEAIRRCRDVAEFCDIFFQVDAQTYDLHKLVLATKMKGFVKTCLTNASQLKDGGNNPEERIVLRELPGGSKAFTDVVQFCYGDNAFALTIENVASLHHAAKFFGMTDPGNLFDLVETFLENKIFGADVKDHAPAIALYKSALPLETSHCLPADLSERCMVKIVSFFGLPDYHLGADNLILSFGELIKWPSSALVTQVAQREGVPMSCISNFVAEIVVRSLNQQPFAAKKDIMQTLQKMLSAVDITLIREELMESLVTFDEQLFSHFDQGRVEFVRSFLVNQDSNNPETNMSTDGTLHLARTCLSLFNNDLETQPQNKDHSQCLVQASLSLVSLLIEKLQSTEMKRQSAEEIYEESRENEWKANTKYETLLQLLRLTELSRRNLSRPLENLFSNISDDELCQALVGFDFDLIPGADLKKGSYALQYESQTQTFVLRKGMCSTESISVVELCNLFVNADVPAIESVQDAENSASDCSG